MNAPIPLDEAERLQGLQHYDILDTLPEAEFDDLVRLAAEICDVPIALMSLVDTDRQWFKAAVGLEEKETPRSVAFCAHAILQRDLFTVLDAKMDTRFATNPLVTGSPYLRFYAGAPIQTTEGSAIGTLCVLDRVPRTLTPFQKGALRVLGNEVQAQLELRRRVRQLTQREAELRSERERVVVLQRQREELRSFLVHDLNNALAMILPNAEFILEGGALNADERAAALDLRDGAKRMQRMIGELLGSESVERGRLVVQSSAVDLGALAREVERNAARRIRTQGRKLVVATPKNSVMIRADKALLRRVVENLIDNGLKYGAGIIQISVDSPPDGGVRLTVDDDGPGVPVHDRERIFEARSRLERDLAADGHGIGLAFCRAAIEAHGGRIWVEDHKPVGATFVVQLPGTYPRCNREAITGTLSSHANTDIRPEALRTRIIRKTKRPAFSAGRFASCGAGSGVSPWGRRRRPSVRGALRG